MLTCIVTERPDPAHGNQVVKPVLTVIKGEDKREQDRTGTPEWDRSHLNVTEDS